MKTLVVFLALAALTSPVFSAPKKSPASATPVGFIVPAAGEYVVLVSEKTLASEDWKRTAEKFLKRYDGKLVVWRGDDVSSARDALKKATPRYVAVLAKPEEIDRVFVAKIHRLSREMNDDIFGDFLWGIVTGRNAETAAGLLGSDDPLVLERAIGTTNFDQARFKKSFFITDWGAREFVETENFKASEKRAAAPDAGMVEMFAERWEKICPQFVISSSHATEFNLEMPFGEGLLASAETAFCIVPKSRMPEFVRVLGNAPARREFLKNERFDSLPETPDAKIWFAAGNCLFGDTLRSADSMAITAISAANVKQLVGYTVQSWFGEGGWGTSEKFFNGHETTSVAQAWFFNNQILLKNLPEPLAREEIAMTATDMTGLEPFSTAPIFSKNKIAPTRESLGRLYDRDTVAFYGDPLFRARFNPLAPSTPPWICAVGEKKSGAQIFTVKPAGGNARKGDFCLWFPKRFDTTKKLRAKISGRRGGGKISPDILTENFVIFRGLELAPNETLTLTVPEKK